MEITAFLLIMLGLAAIWLIGLAWAWRGKPWISLGAAVAAVLLGMFGALSVLMLPRDFFSDIGSGDGFGLVALFYIAAACSGIGLVAALLTFAVYAIGTRFNGTRLGEEML